MSKLNLLRSRLASLARRRWLVRLLGGYSGVLLAVLWVLIGAFVVDWLSEMGRPYRAVSLVFIAGVAVWGYFRFVKPMLGLRESVLDMALYVEAQHKVDSDFIAALEFEQPQAKAWGSGQLQGAVVDHVASVAPGVNVYRGMDYRTVSRRLMTLLATVLVIAAGVGLFPGHAAAFFNRLLLGHAHYPTRTVIEEVAINATKLELVPGEVTVVKLPYGSEVNFVALVSGELPESGTAKLWDLAGGLTRDLDLLPQSVHRLSAVADITAPVKRDPGAAAGRKASDNEFKLSPRGFDPTQPPATGGERAFQVYSGRIPQLTASIGFQLFLGDAWTDPARIEIVPLPKVDVSLKVTPPAYTSTGDESLESPEGARQVAVIEGSRVDVVLRASKPLENATLSIKKDHYKFTRTGTAPDGREQWTLADGTPLASVVEPIYYTIQATDGDGLQLDKPIEGYIRLKADRLPKAFADIRTKYVLPGAEANVLYGASDDYGLAELNVKVSVLRTGQDDPKKAPVKRLKLPVTNRPRRISSLLFQLEQSFELTLNRKVLDASLRQRFTQRGVELSDAANVPFARRGGGRWMVKDAENSLDFEIREENSHLNVYRIFPLRLSEFDLRVGDQVRIELEAVDYRGNSPGKAAASEAIFLTVTDESGFLAQSSETDQRSAEQLNAIIRLGLGESP